MSRRMGSVPHRALAHALSAGEVYASAATLAELEHALRRANFDQYQVTVCRRRASANAFAGQFGHRLRQAEWRVLVVFDDGFFADPIKRGHCDLVCCICG